MDLRTIQVLDGLPVTLTPEKNALFVRASEARKRELRLGQPVTLTRTCEACKREFQARRNTAQFCSFTCRKKFNRATQSFLQLLTEKPSPEPGGTGRGLVTGVSAD